MLATHSIPTDRTMALPNLGVPLLMPTPVDVELPNLSVVTHTGRDIFRGSGVSCAIAFAEMRRAVCQRQLKSLCS